MVLVIRPETNADRSDIDRINRDAFGRADEARLVDRLRRDHTIIASLVAEDASGLLTGHILFSPVAILTGRGERLVASLAPMAVLPGRQRQGIGSSLVAAGLDACKAAGYRAAIVVGHPDYYPRFGFSHDLVASLDNPFAKGHAFMGIELARGALSDIGDGRVVYPGVFDQF